jgi:hypothetical protein
MCDRLEKELQPGENEEGAPALCWPEVGNLYITQIYSKYNATCCLHGVKKKLVQQKNRNKEVSADHCHSQIRKRLCPA